MESEILKWRDKYVTLYIFTSDVLVFFFLHSLEVCIIIPQRPLVLKARKKKKRPIENKLPSYRLTTDKHFSPIKVYLSTF